MKKRDGCKSCLFISCFFTVNLVVSAQEKSFYKNIINNPIKLDFSQIEAKAEHPADKKDSFQIAPSNANKNTFIISTYNYGFNVIDPKMFENIPSEDTALTLSPTIFTPYTNEKAYQETDGPHQLEYSHGTKQMVARPNYKSSKGSDLSRFPKSRKQRKKDKALEYITTVVYPTDSIKKNEYK